VEKKHKQFFAYWLFISGQEQRENRCLLVCYRSLWWCTKKTTCKSISLQLQFY